jgi:hypothetical protein
LCIKGKPPKGGISVIVDCGFKEFPEKYKNPKSTTEPKASSAKPIRNPKYGKFRFAEFRGVRSRKGF